MSKNPHAVSLGRKGGKSTSEAKKAAVRQNVAKARKAKQDNLTSVCVCGHYRGDHSSGSLTDCQNNCGCLNFKAVRHQKREADGKYAFDGNLERLCVCGHTLGRHCAGSPADCLFYSLPSHEREGQPGADKPECGCQKFRESRAKINSNRTA